VFKIDVEIEAREVEAKMNLIRQDGIISQSQPDFASPIIVEKRNGPIHVPIRESSREYTAVVGPTSPSCLEDTVIMNRNLLYESLTTDITAVASDGDNADGCDEKNFVRFTEYCVNCTVEQTKSENLGISIESQRAREPTFALDEDLGITLDDILVNTRSDFRCERHRSERDPRTYFSRSLPTEYGILIKKTSGKNAFLKKLRTSPSSVITNKL
jgi:hypothetical protein